MTHTYNTLTDAIVKQYAYIWSYERLRTAEENLEERCFQIVATIFHKNNNSIGCFEKGEFGEFEELTVQELNVKLEEARRYHKIIMNELIKRVTPISQNVANGIYGKFDGRGGIRRRRDARWNI